MCQGETSRGKTHIRERKKVEGYGKGIKREADKGRRKRKRKEKKINIRLADFIS